MKWCWHKNSIKTLCDIFPCFLLETGTVLICPRHEMGEGHIEFTLCVCVFQSCPGHNLAYMRDLKIIGTNDNHDKTICREQEPCC